MTLKKSLPGAVLITHYTPIEALAMGIFGGTAYYKVSSLQGVSQEDKTRILSIYTPNREYNPNANYFKGSTENTRHRGGNELPPYIKAQSMGGWFPWYMRFYLGDSANNGVNIMRMVQHRDLVRRYHNALLRLCNQKGKELSDLSVGIDYRQGLLHLCWDSTKRPKDEGY